MIVAQPRVRNFTGPRTVTVRCLGTRCGWEEAIEGPSPSTAKRRANQALTEHMDACADVAAGREQQRQIEAAFRARQAAIEAS